MENIKALWSIELMCECPNCLCDFDLVKCHDDFWVDGCQPIEHGTAKTKNVEVECPICSLEFKVDYEY